MTQIYQITKQDAEAIDAAATVLRDTLKWGGLNEASLAEYREALAGLMSIYPVPVIRTAIGTDPKGAA